MKHNGKKMITVAVYEETYDKMKAVADSKGVKYYAYLSDIIEEHLQRQAELNDNKSN